MPRTRRKRDASVDCVVVVRPQLWIWAILVTGSTPLGVASIFALYCNGSVTITVDEDVLRQARIRALEQGKSVNAILAEYLRSYADRGAAQVDATRALIGLSRESTSSKGNQRWTRDGGR